MNDKIKFSLDDIFLPLIMFRLNPNFKPKDGKININSSIEVDYSLKDKSLSVNVQVEMPDEENVPFSFMVVGVGKFTLSQEPQNDELEIIAQVNCAAMIYPYIREAVADLTRKAGVPPLHLQPVNFYSRLKHEKNKNDSTAVKNARIPKKRTKQLKVSKLD